MQQEHETTIIMYGSEVLLIDTKSSHPETTNFSILSDSASVPSPHISEFPIGRCSLGPISSHLLSVYLHNALSPASVSLTWTLTVQPSWFNASLWKSISKLNVVQRSAACITTRTRLTCWLHFVHLLLHSCCVLHLWVSCIDLLVLHFTLYIYAW